MLVPDPEKEQQDFIIVNDNVECRTDSVEPATTVSAESGEGMAEANAPFSTLHSQLDNEFDLSDITHKEKSREDIIAEAEAAAFAED